MKRLWVSLLLIISGAVHAATCDNAAGAKARAECLKAHTQALLERTRNDTWRKCKPGENGSQDATCYRNNADSTCYYADGSRAPYCGEPDCAYGSAYYGSGSGKGKCEVCPPGTPLAGEKPKEGSCGGIIEPPSGPVSKTPFFIIPPGGEVPADFSVYVPPGFSGEIAATAELTVAGDPKGDLAAFLNAMSGAEKVSGPNPDALTTDMSGAVDAIKAGGTVTMTFLTSGWAGSPPDCGGPPPTPPQVQPGDLSWGDGARSSIPGGSTCGSYGMVAVTGTMKNAADPVNEQVVFKIKASSRMADGCVGDSPLVAPGDSAPAATGAIPTIRRVSAVPVELSCSAETHVEEYPCGTEKEPRTCTHDVHSPEDGSTDVTQWHVTYLVSAPNVKVTHVNVDATGGGGLHFP